MCPLQTDRSRNYVLIIGAFWCEYQNSWSLAEINFQILRKSSEYHWLGSVLRIQPFQLLVKQTQQPELPEIISELWRTNWWHQADLRQQDNMDSSRKGQSTSWSSTEDDIALTWDCTRKQGSQLTGKDYSPLRLATIFVLQTTMTPNNSSFSFNNSTGYANTTSKTNENLQLCPPIPNVRFESLNSSFPYFVNAALSVPLAIGTTVANLVVLLAIRHVTSIRLPSKLLLCSLVMTDLGAGSVAQPQFAAFLFLRAVHPNLVPCSLFQSYLATVSIFASASLLTLAAISLDRYAALFFYLKYQQTVTTRRVCAVLAFIWTYAMLYALTTFQQDAMKLRRVVAFTVAVLTLFVIFVACAKIYRRLRAPQSSQPQAPDQAQQQAGNTLNMARYRRTASAMMWICVLLLICYLPFLCIAAFSAAAERTPLTECLLEFSISLMLLNSFLNPFVYCFRLPDVRREVVKQLHKLFCRSSSDQWTEDKVWNWAHMTGWLESIHWTWLPLSLPSSKRTFSQPF